MALRDVNQDNDGLLAMYLAWAQATSLDQFVRSAEQGLACPGMPWVNTLAIGRSDERAWYGDVGAVPYAPDDLRKRCATPLSQLVQQWDPAIPVLDGSRATCEWQIDQATPIAGQMPAARLPALFRTDYVANMNDSHWLANAAQPLEGYDAVLGAERQPLSLRGRYGHDIARRALAASGPDQRARFLETETLDAGDYAAMRFKPALLARACGPTPPGALAAACSTLSAWSGRAQAQDRGALLWGAFWQRLQDGAAAQPAADAARLALEQAVRDLEQRGAAVDAPLGAYLKVATPQGDIPLFGGCGSGYFTVACPAGATGAMDARAYANTYLQIVRFGAEGVRARTLLASGEGGAALQGGTASELVRQYAERRWSDMPWTQAQVEAVQISVRYLDGP